MKKAIFFNLIGLILVSCGPKITKEQAKKLDQLSAKIDSSVNILINEIDSSRLIQFSNDFFKRKAFFENEMKDTIDRETIFIIDDYMRSKKAMKYVQLNLAPIIQEARIMKDQIQDLYQ